MRMGKLVKFEGEYEPGKKPVEEIDNVGTDSLTPDLIEIDRLITDDIVQTYFPAFASLAALAAAGPNPLSYDILTYGTLVEAEIKAASRDNRNARDRPRCQSTAIHGFERRKIPHQPTGRNVDHHSHHADPELEAETVSGSSGRRGRHLSRSTHILPRSLNYSARRVLYQRPSMIPSMP